MENKNFDRREVAIGKIEWFHGAAYRCVEGKLSDQCGNCDMNGMSCDAFVCGSDCRLDGKNIIFKKVKGN